ncbi:MAG: S8 family serine peptidase [Burkholderiaceae bacterium]|nr:S8 family serine peptidase [Burkholderiaceae bacterium]
MASPLLVVGLMGGAMAMGAATAAAERGPVQRTAALRDEDPSGARVVVRFKSNSSAMRAAQRSNARGGTVQALRHPMLAALMTQRLGLALKDGRALDGRTQVMRGDPGLSSAALAARLATDPDVEFAVPDRRRHTMSAGTPDDPLFAANANATGTTVEVGQWYLRAPVNADVDGYPSLSAINAVGAWVTTQGASSVVVADVDTGVITTHPDLVNKLLPGYNFVSSSGSMSTSGWSAGAGDPGDWTTAGECGAGSSAEASDWHGTQVMGLIGAQTNNGIGMASVAPNVMLLPVRSLGPCGGYDSDIMAGILWAAGIALPADNASMPNGSAVPANPNPANVINLSLGGSGSCSGTVYQTYFPQVLAKNIVIVAAAGNDEGLAVSVPANCSGVIAVAALRNVGTKVGFSDLGPEVTLSAPGGNCINGAGAPCLRPLLTTSNAGTTTPDTSASGDIYTGNGSNASLGTSFATPLVSGTAALMLSVNPALKPAQISSLLQSSATAFPTQPSPVTSSTAPMCAAPSNTVQNECYCTATTCGAGMLNASAAVSAAAALALPTASISPASASVAAGGSVSLSATGSSAAADKTLSSYLWSITSGATLASFSSATNSSSVTLATTAPGSVTVQLTVTDSAGLSASSSATITVTAASTGTSSGSDGTSSSSASSSHGGGLSSPWWLGGLLLLGLALQRLRRA